MGSTLEFNDTLKLRRGEGFPQAINLTDEYTFTLKGRRMFHMAPVRVFLVEEIEGKWNFIGQALISELTINALDDTTSGRFKLAKLYGRDYAMQLNQHDAPEGKGYTGFE